MSGITRVCEKMKKKISFGDYSLPAEPTKILQPEVELNAEPAARKIYSLTKEDSLMLYAIFSKRTQFNKPSSISQIMSEAIQLLYNQEYIV